MIPVFPPGVSVRSQRMQAHPHPNQQPLQHGTFAQHGAPQHGIVEFEPIPPGAGVQGGTELISPGQIPVQRAGDKTPVILSSGISQVIQGRILKTGRHGIAQPLPPFLLPHAVSARLSRHQRQGAPWGQGIPQHMGGIPAQGLQQIPQFPHLGLDRRGGAQNHVPGSAPRALHEAQQVVFLSALFRPLRPGPVRLIQNHQAVHPVQQHLALTGKLFRPRVILVHDNPGGHNADAARAAADALQILPGG